MEVPITTCTWSAVAGTVSLTIQSSPPFTVTAQGMAHSDAATALAAALNVSSSPVTATASGSNVTVTAKATGLGSNYAYTGSAATTNFGFTTPTGALSGGWAAGTDYDTGTVSVTVSDSTWGANWAQGSTQASLAAALAASINAAAGIPATSCPTPSQLQSSLGFVSACAPTGSSVVTLTSLDGGLDADWSVAVSDADTNALYFSAPSFTVARNAATLSGGANTTANLLYSYRIPDQAGFAANGNLLNVVDSVTGTWNYTYDDLNRLKSAAATAGYFAGAQTAWAIDSFGNLSAQTQGGTPQVTMPTSRTVGYTAASNQVSSFTYDAAGNVIVDNLNSYAYDAEGRLCAAKTAGPAYTGYLYDAAGTRVAKGTISSLSCNFATNGFTLNTSWVLDPSGEQVTEYDGSGNWKHTNLFTGGQLLATYVAGETDFALNDWLGTKREK